MSLIEWREDYCTGIKGVDYEHEQLIGQINSVYDLIAEQDDRTLVVDALGEIYGSISAHFALEEQMMRRHNYDHYEQHKTDHEALLDQIREITDEYENTILLDDTKFKQKLADWFQRHFSTHDSRLHNLAARSHDPISQPNLKTMIKNAKNKLLQRHDHQV